MKKSTRNILIAVCAVVLLVGILLLVTLVPWGGDSATDITTSTYPTDENGEQYATDAMGNKIPSEKDKNGNILSAGIVTLADQGPLNLEKIEVQNDSGSFTVLAETQTTQASKPRRPFIRWWALKTNNCSAASPKQLQTTPPICKPQGLST